VDHSDRRTPRSSDEQVVCEKCSQRTAVKAVLPVGVVVYLRCPECGSVWPIQERRDIYKRRPDPAA
jgi:uncharacterized Zn finger protein